MGYQRMYDTKWDGQSTHRCSSWHQKQTTGRGHRFESHNSLGSESSPDLNGFPGGGDLGSTV